jgi:hypothetical protein
MFRSVGVMTILLSEKVRLTDLSPRSTSASGLARGRPQTMSRLLRPNAYE